MKVKCVIFAFCVILYSSVEAHNKEFQVLIDKCVASAGVDGKIVDKLFTNKMATTDDPKIKCVFKCILEETKWMDSNGDIVEGSAMALPENEIKLARICKNFTPETDPCEKSYNFHKCFMAMKHTSSEE